MFNKEKTYKENLQVGQRIYCSLYGGKNGTIYEIKGEQTPNNCKSLFDIVVSGGNANILVVWDNGTTSNVPECLIRSSVQWNIFEEVETSEQIEKRLEYVELKNKERVEKEKIKAKKEDKEAERIKKEYDYLEQVVGYNGYKIVSKNLKKELRKTFKGVKFSVKKDNNSLYVNYTNGPSLKSVKEIVNKYEEGYFDGMNDIYEYNSSVWNSVFGGIKYTNVNRNYSKEVLEENIKKMGFNELTLEKEYDDSFYVKGLQGYMYNEFYTELDNKNLN